MPPGQDSTLTRDGSHRVPVVRDLVELRARLDELPRDRDISVICRSGQRAYYATRILMQNGFKVRNIAGGMLSRSHAASATLEQFHP